MHIARDVRDGLENFPGTIVIGKYANMNQKSDNKKRFINPTTVVGSRLQSNGLRTKKN